MTLCHFFLKANSLPLSRITKLFLVNNNLPFPHLPIFWRFDIKISFVSKLSSMLFTCLVNVSSRTLGEKQQLYKHWPAISTHTYPLSAWRNLSTFRLELDMAIPTPHEVSSFHVFISGILYCSQNDITFPFLLFAFCFTKLGHSFLTPSLVTKL